MKLLNKLNKSELQQSLITEIAKARNEIKCAEADIKKVNSRLSFLVVLANELIQREDKKENSYEDKQTGSKATVN